MSLCVYVRQFVDRWREGGIEGWYGCKMMYVCIMRVDGGREGRREGRMHGWMDE